MPSDIVSLMLFNFEFTSNWAKYFKYNRSQIRSIDKSHFNNLKIKHKTFISSALFIMMLSFARLSHK